MISSMSSSKPIRAPLAVHEEGMPTMSIRALSSPKTNSSASIFVVPIAPTSVMVSATRSIVYRCVSVLA